MNGDGAASEAVLLERVRSGDAAAFEALFRAHYPQLLRFAHGQLGPGPDAEDVVHDVLLRLWRDRAGLLLRGSLRAYLLTAVRNRAIDMLRHRAVAVSIELPAAAAAGQAGAAVHDPGDPAELAELDRAIRGAVAGLPERCRLAFQLCREQELTYAEAAEVMGVTPATVKTQMARALAAIRDALQPFFLLLLAVRFLLR